MSLLQSLSDAELVERLPVLVRAERQSMIDVIEHLVEMERRRLYLSESCSSLYRYCIDRLGYSEDAALNRHRVTLLALRVPIVFDELRAGTIHLTGLFLLSNHLDAENAAALLSEARGKSLRQVRELIACRFPRPDVPSVLEPLGTGGGEREAARLAHGKSKLSRAGALPFTCIDPGRPVHARLDPLSPSRLRVEFTASAQLYGKVEKARELLSHALPSGDLGELFERALDALIERETRKRFGAGRPRKARGLKPGSRHVPVEIQRAVWERDDARCTFADGEGRRCEERRFLTIEHRTPFALGGPPTPENLCLLCSAHNLERARQVFGESFVEAKIDGKASLHRADVVETASAAEPHLETPAKVLSSLCGLGFSRSEASAAVGRALGIGAALDTEELLRRCLELLVARAG